MQIRATKQVITQLKPLQQQAQIPFVAVCGRQGLAHLWQTYQQTMHQALILSPYNAVYPLHFDWKLVEDQWLGPHQWFLIVDHYLVLNYKELSQLQACLPPKQAQYVAALSQALRKVPVKLASF